MTIVKLPPLVEALYLAHSFWPWMRKLRGQRRLLLRPHGSGGHVRGRNAWDGRWATWRMADVETTYLTRARAAQAVYRG